MKNKKEWRTWGGERWPIHIALLGLGSLIIILTMCAIPLFEKVFGSAFGGKIAVLIIITSLLLTIWQAYKRHAVQK